MASLKALKIRIGSVKSTQKITKAMKMVAAAKLRRAQEAAEAGASLCRAAGARSWPASRRKVDGRPEEPEAARRHRQGPGPSAGRRDLRPGLAGAFNTNIVRAARRKADELIAAGQDGPVLPRRQKGRAVHPAPLSRSRSSIRSTPSEIKNARLRRRAGDRRGPDRALRGRRVRRRAPVLRARSSRRWCRSRPSSRSSRSPIAGRSGAATDGALAAVEYEPDEEEILADLLPRNVAIQIFRALLENAASEQGSQMTAMDNATRNAGDMIKRLIDPV